MFVRGFGLKQVAAHTRGTHRTLSRLANALKFVKSVDALTKQLEETAVTEKIDLLLTQIGHLKPHLNLLQQLFKLCASVGIVAGNTDARPTKRTPSFLFAYLFKLRPIHDAFWDMCRLTDVLQQSHPLHCDPKYLGLLDPVNFSEPTYKKILRGEIGDVE